MHRHLMHADQLWCEHLSCPAPPCEGKAKPYPGPENVRVFTRLVISDADGQPVVGANQGPYLIPYGTDFNFLSSGGMYILIRKNGRLSVSTFKLELCQNPHDLDEYLVPDFGFNVRQVTWLCPTCNPKYKDHPNSLIQIITEAAAKKGLILR